MSDPGRTEWEEHWEPPGYGTYGWGVEDLEPRWTPDVPLAGRITRVGRFRGIDPSKEGSLWPPSKWWALASYIGIVAWAFTKARRITGVPRNASQPTGGTGHG